MFPSPLPGRPPQISCQEDPDDLVEVLFVDREAQLSAVKHHVHRFADRRLDRHGHDVDPRRHDFADRDLVELHHIRHHLELVLVDRPLTASELGEDLDLGAADGGRAGFAGRDPPAQEAQRHEHRLHHDDHEAQQVRGRAGQLPPEHRAESLGDDLRQHQHGKGERSREHPDPDIAEDPGGDRAAPRGANRVGDRIEGQDCGDRLVDPVLHPMQDLSGALPAALQESDEGVIDRQEDSLQDRAHEGHRKRHPDDGKELDHAALASADAVSLPFIIGSRMLSFSLTEDGL